MRTIKEILEEEIDYKIREILTRNFDNDKYAWSDAHTELKSLISSTQSHLIEEIIKMAQETNNFRQAKVDGKEDWNNALEQSACKIDALITNLSTLIEGK